MKAFKLLSTLDDTIGYSLNHSVLDNTIGYSLQDSLLDTTVGYTRQNKPTQLRFGTFNCRGLQSSVKQQHLLTDAIRYHLSVISLQETHIKDQQQLTLQDQGKTFTLILAETGVSTKNRCTGGLGFLIDATLPVEFTRVSDRICYIKFNIKNRPHYIVNTYAPTLPNSEKQPAIRQTFYNELDALLDTFPDRAVLYLTGDFNAKTGSSHNTHPHIVGPYGKGHTNSNGQHLLDLADKHGLYITNTHFRHKLAHRATWTSNFDPQHNRRNPIRNQIDYILVKKHHIRHITNSRSYSGTTLDSDHRLVIIDTDVIWTKLKPKNKQKPSIFNTDPDHILEYQRKIKESYRSLPDSIRSDNQNENPTQTAWNQIVKTCLSATAQTTKQKPTVSPVEIELQKLSKTQKDIRNKINTTQNKDVRQRLQIQ